MEYRLLSATERLFTLIGAEEVPGTKTNHEMELEKQVEFDNKINDFYDSLKYDELDETKRKFPEHFKRMETRHFVVSAPEPGYLCMARMISIAHVTCKESIRFCIGPSIKSQYNVTSINRNNTENVNWGSVYPKFEEQTLIMEDINASSFVFRFDGSYSKDPEMVKGGWRQHERTICITIENDGNVPTWKSIFDSENIHKKLDSFYNDIPRLGLSSVCAYEAHAEFVVKSNLFTAVLSGIDVVCMVKILNVCGTSSHDSLRVCFDMDCERLYHVCFISHETGRLSDSTILHRLPNLRFTITDYDDELLVLTSQEDLIYQIVVVLRADDESWLDVLTKYNMVGIGNARSNDGLNNKQDLIEKNVNEFTKNSFDIIISNEDTEHPAVLSYIVLSASDATVRISDTNNGCSEWYLVDSKRPEWQMVHSESVPVSDGWESAPWSYFKYYFEYEGIQTMNATIAGNSIQLSHAEMRLTFKSINGAPSTLLNKLFPVPDGESEEETHQGPEP